MAITNNPGTTQTIKQEDRNVSFFRNGLISVEEVLLQSAGRQPKSDIDRATDLSNVINNRVLDFYTEAGRNQQSAAEFTANIRSLPQQYRTQLLEVARSAGVPDNITVEFTAVLNSSQPMSGENVVTAQRFFSELADRMTKSPSKDELLKAAVVAVKADDNFQDLVEKDLDKLFRAVDSLARGNTFMSLNGNTAKTANNTAGETERDRLTQIAKLILSRNSYLADLPDKVSEQVIVALINNLPKTAETVVAEYLHNKAESLKIEKQDVARKIDPKSSFEEIAAQNKKIREIEDQITKVEAAIQDLKA